MHVHPEWVAGRDERIDAKIELVAVDQERLRTEMVFTNQRYKSARKALTLRVLAYPGHVHLAYHTFAGFHVLQVPRQVDAATLAARVRLDDERLGASQFRVRHRIPVAENFDRRIGKEMRDAR